MLILRIRQAESALKDGRLDEAFELARADDVRAHRRGQKLVGRLARALIERGGQHLAAGRWPQAMADCEKAGRLAGNLPEIAELRAAITDAVQTRQQSDRRRAGAVAAARRHIENGQLSVGEQVLADLDSGDGRGRELHNELAARRAAGEAALARARSALERDDWAAAIKALSEARSAHASNQELSELTARVVSLVTRRAGAAVDQGRLDLARSMMQQLGPLAVNSIDVQELEWIIEQCDSAARCVHQHRPRQAVEILRRLSAIRPSASWLADALNDAQQAAERLEQLRGGPLGLLTGDGARVANESETTQDAETLRLAEQRALQERNTGPALPARFMLHVDGVGSFLVLPDRRVAIGPAGSSRHVDVGLLAEAGLPTATIERVDEDYFLFCEVPVRVENTPVTRKLLVSGDRIALSGRCRLKFTVPNAASTSAILSLSGTRLPRSDARRVILLDREMILGPGSSAHIRADELPVPAVLQVRDGRLFCRTDAEVTVNDRPMDRLAGIPVGARVRIGPVSLVVTEA